MKTQKNILKQTNGITLIALVITIIVLLILAGVSISAITGSESAMEKAKQAKNKSEAADELDTVKLAVVEAVAHSNDGLVHKTELDTALANVGIGASTEEGGKFKISGQKGVYKVSQNGLVELDSGVTVVETSLNLIKGASGTVTATVSTDLTYEALTWRSDNEAVATADNTGKVTVKSNATVGQTAKIYAKAGNIESTNYCEVTVSQLMSDVTGLTASAEVGETITFNIPANTESVDHYELVNSSDSEFVDTTNGLRAVKITTSAVSVKVYGASGNYTTASVTVTGGVTPVQWEKIADSNTGNNWYNYGGKTIKGPNLLGNMKAIKYTGTFSETESTKKWANAITKDGSMFVWIPRYAYRIQSGSHTATASAIDVIFVGKDNKDLETDPTKKVADANITTDPTADGAGTTKYLVHPAFTAVPANGGWSEELEGFWFAKFESTGTSSALSVKPGLASLVSMTIGEQFTLAKNTTFEENSTSILKSHMVKNSEWGAVAYLAQSSYGAAAKVENNGVYYAGGVNCTGANATSANYTKIYTDYKTRSTTHNATGVYDMNGGAWEYVASYRSGTTGYADLTQDGGSTATTSTAYKTVYPTSYNLCNNIKGDAIYETSSAASGNNTAWYSAYAYFPTSSYPFFVRSGSAGDSGAGSFYFSVNFGDSGSNGSFRVALCP